jgi:ABC-2 type transport system ATP-binding protein
MIQVEGLSKRYGRTLAVDNISFAAGSGEILGFLGPNGAGKTTTMRVLTCFLPPTSGRARVAGYDVLEQPLEVKRRVGYLPETPPLYPEMRVSEYLTFVARIKGVARARVAARVGSVIETCALKEVRQTLISKLSRGYRQRVGLAQAIIHEPQILVLDEPTAGLDPKQIIDTRELIKSLAGDHTIILSSHILSEVQATCQRVIIINAGKLVAVDTPENLTARLQGHATVYVQAEGPAEQLREKLERVAGVVAVKLHGAPGHRPAFEIEVDKGRDLRGELARAVVHGGWTLLELRPMGLSLEEIFLELTREEAEASAVAAPPKGKEAAQ